MIIVQTCTFIDNYPYTGYNQCNKISLKRKENESMQKAKSILLGLAYAVIAVISIATGEPFLIVLGVIMALIALPCIIVGVTTSEKQLQATADAQKKRKEDSKWRYKEGYFYFNDKCIHVSDVSLVTVDVAMLKMQTSYLNIFCVSGEKYRLPVPQRRLDEAIHLQSKVALDKLSCKTQQKENAESVKVTSEDRDKLVDFLTTDPALNPKKEEKKASVVGRAVVGGIIAGETGAVVGALSAVDKNNKKK